MGENKRYYWLKLNEAFFEDDTIDWIEEQENGERYVLFYLKLCLKSLKDDGYLARYVGNQLMPYNIKALAKLTNTDHDTVAVSLKIFEQIGLIERKATGEIYMAQIDEMIGSETDVAKRVRKSRAKELVLQSNVKLLQSNTKPLQSNKRVTKCNTEIEIEIDTELEIDNTSKKKDVVSLFFEDVWLEYPRKRGKGSVSDTKKKALYELGDELTRCIDRYKDEVKGKNNNYIMYGSTFFNSGYIDYLDENYQPPTTKFGAVKASSDDLVINMMEERQDD